MVFGSACIVGESFIARGIVVFETLEIEQLISDITNSALYSLGIGVVFSGSTIINVQTGATLQCGVIVLTE